MGGNELPQENGPNLEDLIQIARQNADLINAIDPIITHLSRSFERTIGIIFVSCSHLGGRYTFYSEFQELLEKALKIKNLYWVSLGDDVESFIPGFPDASAVLDQAIANPKVQRLMLAKVLEKLTDKGKLLAGMASQHGGDWVRKKTGDDPIKDLYLAQGVPYFDGKALMTLEVGDSTYRLACAHELRGNSIYNPNHPQRRAALFEFPNADAIIMGDRHVSAVQRISLPAWEYDAGIRSSLYQWFVQVGTFKAGLDRYSIRGWSRGILDFPILIFHADEHRIEWTDSLERARLMLRN